MRDTSRPIRPRGLGRAAKTLAVDAQCKLTAADRRLAPLYDVDDLQVRDTANAVGRLISNAAKLISDLLGLGMADEPGNGEDK